MAPRLASAAWMLAALLHLALTLRTISSWIQHTHYDFKHVNPAWFILVVGNIIVPIVAAWRNQICVPE